MPYICNQSQSHLDQEIAAGPFYFLRPAGTRDSCMPERQNSCLQHGLISALLSILVSHDEEEWNISNNRRGRKKVAS